MNKIIKISFLLMLFIIFCMFYFLKHRGNKVIQIISPTEVVIDFNRNEKTDPDEFVCIEALQTFTSNLSIDQTDLAKKVGINNTDAIINSTDLLIIPLNKNNIEGIIESANALKTLFFLKHIIQIAQ